MPLFARQSSFSLRNFDVASSDYGSDNDFEIRPGQQNRATAISTKKKGAGMEWTPEEDDLLRQLVSETGKK